MSNLKILVRGAYDIQKLRIQMGNRLVGNFKAKLGQAPSEPEDTIDITGQVVLKQLRADYKKITDGIQALPTFKKFKSHGVIDTYIGEIGVPIYGKVTVSAPDAGPVTAILG